MGIKTEQMLGTTSQVISWSDMDLHNPKDRTGLYTIYTFFALSLAISHGQLMIN